jgi:MFS family permease
LSHTAHPFTSQATGITQSGTYIGGTIGPLAFGLLFTVLGPAGGWIIAASVAALGAAAAMVARNFERKLTTSQTP